MNSRLGPATAALAVVLAGTALSACGDEGDAASAESSQSTPAPAMKGGALTRSNFGSVVSAAMRRAGSVHVESGGVSDGQVALRVVGDQRIGSTPRHDSMALTFGSGSEQMAIRHVDGTLYLDLGPRTGNKFLTLDTTDANDPLVSQFGRIPRQFNVFTQFEALRDSLVSFERVGDQKAIDGVMTTRYDITFDAAKVAKALGIGRSSLPQKSAYTYYIGADNLPRRMVTSSLGPTVTTNFSDWGGSVEIVAPPSSQLMDRSAFEHGG